MKQSEIVAHANALKQAKYPNGTTRGACLEAANDLFQYFFARGLNCSVQFGFFKNKKYGHAWFEYWDEEQQSQVIVDITADQFDSTLDIVVGTPESLPHYLYEND